MKPEKIITVIFVVLLFTSCNAQISNATTESVKINGNCEMCESTIEKAGNVKMVAAVDWNKDTKIAILTYDTTKTNQDEILKRIALAGYDSENFLAPDEVYAKLPGCCQYERTGKTETAPVEVKDDHAAHEQHATAEDPAAAVVTETNQLEVVFKKYFALKDALILSNGALAADLSKELLTALNGVQMNKLSNEAHVVWMNVMKDLAKDAGAMVATKELEVQRVHFIALSDNMYQLLKESKLDTPTYYQHCPMANEGKGANWLSKESAIKNPYYGSSMLTCGKTVEKIE